MEFTREKNNILTYRQNGTFYYKLAQRCMDREDLSGALGYLRRAVSTEQNNPEYRLALADVLSQMGMFDRSCRILYRLMDQEEEYAQECAYYLGYNLMSMGEYERALTMLQLCLSASPEGEYAEDAEDLMYTIYEYYEEMETLPQAERLADEGKDAMDEGDYPRAVERLRRAIEADGSLSHARNNLCICCYAMGEWEKGREQAEMVYAEDPKNVFANCNLLLYYQATERFDAFFRKLDELETLAPRGDQDVVRLGLSLGENRRDAAALSVFQEGIRQFGQDNRLLFFCGIAAYNSKQYDRAVRYFAALSRQEWEDSVAGYFRALSQKALTQAAEIPWLPYRYQVPMLEAARRVSVLKEVLRGGELAARGAYLEDAEFRSYVHWGLEIADDRVRGACIEVLAMVGTGDAADTLYGMLLSETYSDEVKKEVLAALQHIGDPGPYLALMNHEVVRAKLSAYDPPAERTEEYRQLLALLAEGMRRAGRDEWTDETISLLCDLILRLGVERVLSPKREHLCAALLYLVAQKKGVSVTKEEAARVFRSDLMEMDCVLESWQEEGE